MSPHRPEDAALVAKALEGDSRAFDALMDLYYSSVYRLALRRLGDTDEAYDITDSVDIVTLSDRHI